MTAKPQLGLKKKGAQFPKSQARINASEMPRIS